jgi:hypothetical protein
MFYCVFVRNFTPCAKKKKRSNIKLFSMCARRVSIFTVTLICLTGAYWVSMLASRQHNVLTIKKGDVRQTLNRI